MRSARIERVSAAFFQPQKPRASQHAETKPSPNCRHEVVLSLHDLACLHKVHAEKMYPATRIGKYLCMMAAAASKQEGEEKAV
jgi:hypothetical protein